MTVIRALWVPSRITNFQGQHYSLTDAQTGPAPAHNIGIWLGAAGPRMLNLLGRRQGVVVLASATRPLGSPALRPSCKCPAAW
jgi:alkanesulfonate monooxygenase SsuD/methylene tetrahydromethanopterin reductase-like flavin-dependent oxidoreductase (luciferase family)